MDSFCTGVISGAIYFTTRIININMDTYSARMQHFLLDLAKLKAKIENHSFGINTNVMDNKKSYFMYDDLYTVLVSN